LTPESFVAVAEWLSRLDTNTWLTSEWRGRIIDPAIVALAVRNKRNRLFLVKSDGKPCGVVALADIDLVDRVAMIWYFLGDTASGGRGVTSAAVKALVRLAFEELEIETLYAWIIDGNEPSRRVLEKNGFREVGRMRQAATRSGGRFDRVYFDLTRNNLTA